MTKKDLINIIKYLTIKLYALEDNFNKLLDDLKYYEIDVEPLNNSWEEDVSDTELRQLLEQFANEVKLMNKRISENSCEISPYSEEYKELEESEKNTFKDDDLPF